MPDINSFVQYIAYNNIFISFSQQLPVMFKQIGSPEAKYLAATDILIGDMSDTNYEFLLLNRPVILLANKWLRENFSDIGIKTDLGGLAGAIKRSLDNPAEYEEQRKYWLEKTIHKPDGQSSKRVLNTIIEYSKIQKPNMIFLHAGSIVLKSNLSPLLEEAKRRGFKTSFVKSIREIKEQNKNNIYIAAHFKYLNFPGGYKVHLDHAPKGKGAANVEFSRTDYKRHNYFPLINLHITAGQVGQERTRLQLGPFGNRAVIAGYPKADDLIKLNTKENKKAVYEEFGFDKNKPIITYAPAGKESYMKPGGSLSKEIINKLKEIACQYNYNILVKLKYPKQPIIFRVLAKLKSEFKIWKI